MNSGGGGVGGGGGAGKSAAPVPAPGPLVVIDAHFSATVSAAKVELTKAKEEEAEQKQMHAERESAVGPKTKGEFTEHGHDVLKPGYDYYQKLYNTPGGEMYDLKNAFRAAKVLNPILTWLWGLLSFSSMTWPSSSFQISRRSSLTT